MNRPSTRCALCDLELEAVANDPAAIDAVRSVYEQHLVAHHRIDAQEAARLAADWAEAERLKID